MNKHTHKFHDLLVTHDHEGGDRPHSVVTHHLKVECAHSWVVDPDDPTPNDNEGFVYCLWCGEPKG